MSTWEKQLFKDSPLSIAQGEVSGHSGQHKFGAVPTMSNNQSGTIWDINDTNYPWASWDTAGTIQIPAVATDDGLSVTIEGLDENYEVQTEVVVISSTVATTVSGTWLRVYRAYCTNATNVGAIPIQKGGVTVANIVAGKAQTLMAVYTVPANTTGYLMKGVCTCGANADATGDIYFRYEGQPNFRIGHSFEVSGTGGEYVYEFSVPIRLPEKTDIDVRTSVRTNNARVTAAFDLILVKDGYEHV